MKSFFWPGEAGFCGVSLDKNMDREWHTFDFATPAGFAQGAEIVRTCVYVHLYIYIYTYLYLFVGTGNIYIYIYLFIDR